MLLRYIKDLTIEGIFFLKDWAHYLEDTVLQRHFKEIAMGFADHRSTMVLVGDAIELPHSLSHLAIYHEMPLPGAVEIRETLQATLRNVQQRRAISVDIQAAELPQLIRALGGLTIGQMQRALAFCVYEDGKLSATDIEQILAHKGKLIRAGGLLDFIPVESNRSPARGFWSPQRLAGARQSRFQRRGATVQPVATTGSYAGRRAGLRQVAGRQGDCP